MSNRSMRSLFGGLSLLVAIAALALMATTSAFAFSTGTDTQSSASNNGPLADIGAISALTLNVGSAETVVASFSFASFSPLPSSLAAGNAPGSNSPIRVMYQQWRHLTQNDWFYLYAINSSSSGTLTTPVWDYYYYTPARGATRIAASSANGIAASTAAGISGGYVQASPPAGITTAVSQHVFLTTGNNWPAFQLVSATANSANCIAAAIGGRCGASLSSTLWWSVAGQGFGTGTMTVQEAVESLPLRDNATNSNVVYYDSWRSVLGSTSTQNITLNDAAPVQSASGVTNATGNRNVNTASGYDSIQTSTDAEGDLQSQSLIWVATAAPAGSSTGQTGQWFQAGIYYGRTTGGYSVGASGGASTDVTATAFYQSWNETVSYTGIGSQLTTNYLQSLRVTPCTSSACTTTGSYTRADRGGAGQMVVPNGYVDYTYIYQPLAKGTWSLYGRAEDWHGKTSGNVLVGSQVIS